MKSRFFTTVLLLVVLSFSACSSAPDVQRVDSGSQKECSARYSAMIRENEKNISQLCEFN